MLLNLLLAAFLAAVIIPFSRPLVQLFMDSS